MTQSIESLLPTPPVGYSYTVEQVTPRVTKVWLHHPDYLFKTDVRTIHCFVKSGKVHAARNKDKMRVEAHCPLSELPNCDPYSVINDTHDHPSLLHL